MSSLRMFSYDWKLEDLKKVESNGKKVFGTFICGGGSSMGYKMSGYDHLGGVEIDPKIANIYKHNLDPKYLYIEDIRKFNKRCDIPKELFNLDILDGSPPCSTFSMSGQREKSWNKKKKFREGQAKQTLDDLYFKYLDLVEMLKPKIFVSENVYGLIKGNAKSYVHQIVNKAKKIGYSVQIFLLDAARMGVPQHRKRVFIIGTRLKKSKLKLEFNEELVPFWEIEHETYENKIQPCDLKYFELVKPGQSFDMINLIKEGKRKRFNTIKLLQNKPVNTITTASSLLHYSQKRAMSNIELIRAGAFPQDYNFLDQKVQYVIGMSVPPIMMHKISEAILEQWLN